MKKILPIIAFLLFNMMQAYSQMNESEKTLEENQTDTIIPFEIIPPLLPVEYYKDSVNNNNRGDDENNRSPVNRQLNTSLAVGAIEGYADVTQSGAATYQIPIEVPQGIGGLEPTVSLSYNSQTGKGILGYGWHLSSTSVISRCGKTFYHDNEAAAPQMSNNDNIMLDGKRLILISGTNLTNNAKYRLEHDHTVDIAYQTINSLNYFVVRTKDGTVMEYGSTANSNVDLGGLVTVEWLLSKITDKAGNTITYTYDRIFGQWEYNLASINYAGNRSVQFTYEPRHDTGTSYHGGAVFFFRKRLKKIATYIDQTIVKEYIIAYDSSGVYSKFTDISEIGQNNAMYNATVIDYGNEFLGDDDVARLSHTRDGVTPLFGDFNGDGIMDFFSYATKSPYVQGDYGTLYLGNKNYGGGIYYSRQCTLNIYSPTSFFGFFIADLNGDGKMDLVANLNATNGTTRFNYYFFNGTDFTLDGGFNTDRTNCKEAYVGDYNGDGKNDILVKDNKTVYDGNGVQIASGGIDNWGIEYIKYIFPNCRFFCDFNGNGKTDIMCLDNNGAWVYELNGSSFQRILSFTTSMIKNHYFPYFGDFNGDGKTDVLVWNIYDPDNVYILFSSGNVFGQLTNISNADIRDIVYVGDFNKDGIADIFHVETKNGTTWHKVGIFNGKSFNTSYYPSLLPPISYISPVNPSGGSYYIYLYTVADFDGDGRSDFCNAYYSDFHLIFSFTEPNDLMVSSITNGLGAKTSFKYAPITNPAFCSYTDNGVSFPVTGTAVPLYVTTHVSNSAGTYTDITNYLYKNPKVHKQGKGFLGFDEIEIINANTDRKIVTKYEYDMNYYYPYVTGQNVTTMSGTAISSSVFVNNYIYQGNKRITPYVRKQTNSDFLTGVINSVEIKQMDGWGNPTIVETKYGNDVTETVTSGYSNTATDPLWLIGLPLTV